MGFFFFLGTKGFEKTPPFSKKKKQSFNAGVSFIFFFFFFLFVGKWGFNKGFWRGFLGGKVVSEFWFFRNNIIGFWGVFGGNKKKGGFYPKGGSKINSSKNPKRLFMFEREKRFGAVFSGGGGDFIFFFFFSCGEKKKNPPGLGKRGGFGGIFFFFFFPFSLFFFFQKKTSRPRF